MAKSASERQFGNIIQVMPTTLNKNASVGSLISYGDNNT
jgi:hypothetical protein